MLRKSEIKKGKRTTDTKAFSPIFVVEHNMRSRSWGVFALAEITPGLCGAPEGAQQSPCSAGPQNKLFCLSHSVPKKVSVCIYVISTTLAQSSDSTPSAERFQWEIGFFGENEAFIHC